MSLDLSVIVLSFNTKEVTDECLKRLQKAADYTKKRLNSQVNLIVVDNDSTDGSVEMISKKYPLIKLIASPINTGFSGGNNLGMKLCKTDLILLLNSDAYLEEDTLVQSIIFFEGNKNCDVLGCRLCFTNGKLQPSAGFLPRPLNTALWISGLALLPLPNSFAKPIHPKDADYFSSLRQVEWVMGAFMMFKREVYEQTSGFDESIFMYGEEVEWCKRIQQKGFKIFYNPNFSITHLDKASSKGALDKPLLNEIKGITRYFHQHYRQDYLWIKILMQIFLILRLIIFTVLCKKSRIKAYFEALKSL